MVVVQIITTLAYGGAEKICIDLSNGLSQDPSSEVYLISLFDIGEAHRNPATIDKRVKLITLAKRPGLDARIFYRLYRILSRIKPQIIHTHLTALLYLVPYIYLKREPFKLFHTVHNVAEKDVIPAAQKVFKHLAKNNLFTAIAISEEIRISIREFYGIDSVLIVNFTPKPEKSGRFKIAAEEIKKIKRNSHTKVFLNLARISVAKNQLPLIEAFSELKNENIVLLMVGGADIIYTELQSKLVIASQAAGNVFILGNRDNATDYLFCSNAYILPSLYEGLPVSLLEAIALGVVPMCTPVGGTPSIVIPDQTGFIIDQPDKQAIKNAIFEYLGTEESKLDVMSESCQKLYSSKYSLATGLKDHIALYNS
ncbi:MAG: glycosyltransferase [Mucilaginibacter polytrichastri]|nr:glycosyltransferase [Mucilaginibacter polytrichastri]